MPQHKCFSVNVTKILRTDIVKNIRQSLSWFLKHTASYQNLTNTKVSLHTHSTSMSFISFLSCRLQLLRLFPKCFLSTIEYSLFGYCWMIAVEHFPQSHYHHRCKQQEHGANLTGALKLNKPLVSGLQNYGSQYHCELLQTFQKIIFVMILCTNANSF